VPLYVIPDAPLGGALLLPVIPDAPQSGAFTTCHPGRSAARSGALQTRDPFPYIVIPDAPQSGAIRDRSPSSSRVLRSTRASARVVRC
jgi:hypothetical protein